VNRKMASRCGAPAIFKLLAEFKLV
jgi:hypothetical protein